MRSEVDAVTKLTFRQKAFLSKAIDLYREMREPFRYGLLADGLGVSESTAYDMLRRLEEKGLMVHEYVTPKQLAGPGRSNVVFSPTAKARELFSRLAQGTVDEDEWEEVKSRILHNLRQGKAPDYEDLLRDLLTMIPEADSPLVRCAEIIAVLLVALKEAKNSLAAHGRIGMLLSKLGTQFGKYMETYQESLDKLSHEDVEALHSYTREVLEIMASKEG